MQFNSVSISKNTGTMFPSCRDLNRMQYNWLFYKLNLENMQRYFLSCACLNMVVQIWHQLRYRSTKFTRIWFLSGMCSHIAFQTWHTRKYICTNFTICAYSTMCVRIWHFKSVCWKCTSTNFARMWFLTSICLHEVLQMWHMWKSRSTYFTRICFLSRVSSHMRL